MRHIVVGILMVLGGLNPIVAQTTPTPVAGVEIKLDRSVMSLESPLFSSEGVIYIPLRQVAKSLNASTVYLRKDDAFRIQLPSPNGAITVVPNSTEVFVGTAPAYFSKKTFFMDGQLYLPLEEFFKFLKFSVVRSGNGYSIQSRVDPVNVPALAERTPLKATPQPMALTPTRSIPKLSADIPLLDKDQALFLGFGAKVYPVTGKFMVVQGALYVDMESIFLKEGFSLIKRPTYAELIVGEKTYRFSTRSSDVRVSYFGKIESRSVEFPLIIKDGTPWFAVKAFASALDYGMGWDAGAYRIQMLNRIRPIAIVRKGGILKLAIPGTRPITSLLPIALKGEPGFEVEMVDAQLAAPTGKIMVNDADVKWIELKQVGPSRVRLSVGLKNSGGYSHILPLGAGGEIILSSRVAQVSGRKEGGDWVVKISGDGEMIPKVWGLPSPSIALIVDVPKSYSMLQQAIRPEEGAPYQMVRTSQFSLDPAVTRMVFDMTVSLRYEIRSKSPSEFEIVFKDVSKAPVLSEVKGGAVSSNVTAARPTATAPKKVGRETTLSAPPKPLARRIIVIDAGHGGNDPGGIAADGTYEKDYTIDISNRLKALLEDQGATVLMCRVKDENPSLQERCDLPNNNNSDALLSIHINSFFHSYASGTETYYYKSSDKPLATFIHDEVVKVLGFRDNGVKRARMYVLRNVNMPGMLLEPCFITNPLEFEKLKESGTRQKIAQAVANGTVRYFAEYGNK